MFRALPLLLLSLGVCLQAQTPTRFGLSCQVDAPLSDLRTDLNNKVGGGASFQVSIPVGEVTLFRPRFDLDSYPVSSSYSRHESYRQEVALSSTGLGADWLCAFSGNRDKGLYGLAGVGVLQWFQTHSSWNRKNDNSWQSIETKKNRVSPWVALGLGYQFNRVVGLELRGVGSKFDGSTTTGLQAPFTDAPTTVQTAVTLQTALTLRW